MSFSLLFYTQTLSKAVVPCVPERMNRHSYTRTAGIPLSTGPHYASTPAQRIVCLQYFWLVANEIGFSEGAGVHVEVTVGTATLVRSAVPLLPPILCTTSK